jgi:HEAT repeat protein
MTSHEQLGNANTPALLDDALALALQATDPNDDSLWARITALHGCPEGRVLETATLWLSHDNPNIRCLGADILGQLGCGRHCQTMLPFGSQSLPILLAALGDDSPSVLRSVIVALGHHSRNGQSWDCECLTRFMTHPAPEVRHAVATAIGGHPFDESKKAANMLMRLCGDSDRDVRNWATFGLAVQMDVDTPAIRDTLAQLLLDDDEEIAGEALVGLARRKDNRAVPHIVTLLHQTTVSSLTIEAAGEFPHATFLTRLSELSATNPNDNKVQEALSNCQKSETAG